MRKIFILSIILLTGCFEGKNGSQGSNGASGQAGSEGLNYYSYTEAGKVLEIAGDELRERFEASKGDYYQLPSKFTVVVDNGYADCPLQDLNIIFDTGEEQFKFTFQVSENRYKMIYKSGPLDKVIDGSRLFVYYENSPRVICPEGEYELISQIDFEIRVIEELKVE